MDSTEVTRYQFSGYSLLVQERILMRGNERMPLKPKVFETLLCLVRHHGRLLRKEDLMKSIWGDRLVEEGNISQYIFALRRLFGERPNEHRFIVTVPGEGYRFVAQVQSFREERESIFRSSPNGQVRSLAVFPLSLLGPKETDDFLGLAIADTLITKLSAARDVAIRPTAAILKYSGLEIDPFSLGERLEVDAIVSGTIVESGDRIHLNFQLANIVSRQTLWANKFVVKAVDFLESHDEIAEQVAAALMIELDQKNASTIRRIPQNQDVYQTFLKARYFREKRSEEALRTSLRCAEDVVLSDPGFSLGYVGLADTYLFLGEYLFLAPDEAFPAARRYAEKALLLEPSLSEGYASLAEYYFYYMNDWRKAEEYHQKAIELNPSYPAARHWYTWFLFAMRRNDEALKQIEEAQRLDPGSLILSTIRGLPFYYKRDYTRAIAQFEYVLGIDPQFAHAHYYLGSSLVHSGDARAAIREFEQVVELEPIQQAVALLGYCHAVAGNDRYALEQLAILDQMEEQRYVSPYVRALVHAGLGDNQRALDLLDRGFDEKAAWMVWTSTDPCFDRLSDEPRFKRLMDRLQFPDSRFSN